MRRITLAVIGGILELAASGGAAFVSPTQAQPFPQGQCTGLFCSAIGGSTAPPVVGPPPNCAGMLCGTIGRPFDNPGAPGVLPEAPPPPAAAAPEPVATRPVRHRRVKAKAAKPVAKRTPAPVETPAEPAPR